MIRKSFKYPFVAVCILPFISSLLRPTLSSEFGRPIHNTAVPPPRYNNQSPGLTPEDDLLSTGAGYSSQERDSLSFEEQAAAWRKYQQENMMQQTPEQMHSPTDEQGRMKLFASTTRFSVGMWFFFLIFRSVHHFELADSVTKKNPLMKVFLGVPTVSLFVMNLIGFVSVVLGTHQKGKTKKTLKAILNWNKLIEIICALYFTTRLTIFPSKNIPRELYIGQIIHNAVFVVMGQTFTKVAWGSPDEYKPFSAMPQRTSQEELDPDYNNYYTENDQQQSYYGNDRSASEVGNNNGTWQ
mmetsp:Transcript_20938/g.24093  ORF Transcript_20938/g.24093 Transcript_20938/m.24093 type:complete len:297 (+) Transcript_20938:172-1062(+)